MKLTPVEIDPLSKNIYNFLWFQGPPGSHKKFSENSEMTDEERRQAKIEEETSYELMLKQQQLFLQWQLEMQSKVSCHQRSRNLKEKKHPWAEILELWKL